MSKTMERMEDRVDKQFIGLENFINVENIKKFIRTEIEKTALSVIGEDEIIPESAKGMDATSFCEAGYDYIDAKNELRSEQRAKLQRIIK